MKQRHFLLSINGMQCVDCEQHIEETVLALPGIIKADADFSKETLSLDLDSEVITLKTVCAAIKKAGYQCSESVRSTPATGWLKRLLVIALAATGIVLLMHLDRLVHLNVSLDTIGRTANYGLLFLVGVLTSFHCIGMCGGFVVSYTVADERAGKWSYLNHLFYAVGKIISYSGFGALFGLIGSALTFTLGMRSLASALAGAFLIVYGLSMLDAFKALRRLHIRLPRAVTRSLVRQRQRASHPLVIGLLNGMMIACGPLQAMYIMAAGTESPLAGAKLLAVFALGTLPVMTLFGTLTSVITANTIRYFIRTSGIIILVLGTIMLNRGMMLAGTGYDLNSLWLRTTQAVKEQLAVWHFSRSEASVAPLQEGYQVIYMEVEKHAYVPDRFTLTNGIPVKWIINAKALSSCNRTIVIPSLGRAIDLKPGLQIVEFTPQQAGTIAWSCAMGMIPGSFIVKE